MALINVPTMLAVVFLLSSSFSRVDGFGGVHGRVAGSPRRGSTSVAMPAFDPENSGDRGTATTRDDNDGDDDDENRPRYEVERTDAEWRELLTPDQYYILRKEGTETSGASPLNRISVEKNGEADAGIFTCAGCDVPLFLSEAKYESGTGWPSFYRPVSGSIVGLRTDYKMVVPRTECFCAKCGGHLGHVFEDGPEPTGQRYCMNGAAMEFTRDSESPELAEEAARMALEDPFKLSPAQALPGIAINLLIGGIFFNAFLSSGMSSPIELLTLVPATYYGFLAARSIGKLLG
mmetsp:Transcript_2000/g.5269  ORF Transcript_2000/g.5269 Transcript_2000/m.5269 type:complete len:291 (-) Transcript_2000:192-1064(-)